MNDAEIAAAYVRYHTEGAETDSWAPLELSQLAIDQPERTWRIICLINATRIEDGFWRRAIYSILGCGALEDLIALHEEEMIPSILSAAKRDGVLQMELAAIYETSISSSAWSQIRTALAQQNAANGQPGAGVCFQRKNLARLRTAAELESLSGQFRIQKECKCYPQKPCGSCI